MSGVFITFEGPDGAGKSTQVSILAGRLKKVGISCITTREPGGTPISDHIRSILLDPSHGEMDPRTEVLLYAASRAQLVSEVIRPHLDGGAVVICDRYVDASLAYQGALGLNRSEIEALNRWATDGLTPQRTYILDVPADVGLARVRRAGRGEFGGLDRIEQRDIAYHEAVRQWFLDRAHSSPRYRLIDGTQPMEAVAEQIWQDIRVILNL
ncbi:MAG: dTMP kinase [Alicyclobacillaceae bacterium]|nr:dTMP kinase [Alicyclobacillaceae bacterium]